MELETNQAPGDYSRFGWHPVGRTSFDYHINRSLAATATATAFASALAFGAQQSPEGIDYTHESTGVYTDINSSTSTRTVVEQVPHTGTRPESIGDALTSVSVDISNMPDVPSFDLANSPESQRILNGGALEGLITQTEALRADGWQLSGVNVSGMSSDETRLDDGAGIGQADPRNQALAAQYGSFVAAAVTERFAQAGITLPAGGIAETSAEQVLPQTDIVAIDQIRQAAGFATNLELIQAYKSDPTSLPETTVTQLAGLLDENRGAIVNLTFSKESSETRDVPYTYYTEQCVIETVITETTSEVTSDTKILWPLVLVPIPWLRRRRQEEEEPVVEEPIAEKPAQAAVVTRPEAEPAAKPVEAELEDGNVVFYGQTIDDEGNVSYSREGLKRLRATIERYRRYDKWFPNFPVARPELTKLIDRAGWPDFDEFARDIDRRYKASQTRRWGARIGASLLAVGLLASIRLDAGYCPDPEDHANQPYEFSGDGFIPDRLDISLAIPFTDIETGQAIVWESDCAAPDATPSPRPSTPEPVCDTRTVVIRNGVIVSTTDGN